MFSKARAYIEKIKTFFLRFFGKRAEVQVNTQGIGKAKRGQAKALGLPAFSGSKGQKTWAGALRMAYIKTASAAEIDFLKQSREAKPAAGWIQNRGNLAAWLADLMIAA